MSEVLAEFLKPGAPLWPEVKLFLSLCKTAVQRLPNEVQVANIMNVQRGLKRLSRLEGDEVPLEVQALLHWIIERSEIAGAFCLQRLQIGHQINWICALLACTARIRQFCVEVLEKIESNSAKRKASDDIDTGTPLDRGAFNKRRKDVSDSAAPNETVVTTENSNSFGEPEPTRSERCKSPKEDVFARKNYISVLKSHPYIVKLKADLKLMIDAQPDEAKKASLKKVYGIALKRSLAHPPTNESITKVCVLAMKKARTYSR